MGVAPQPLTETEANLQRQARALGDPTRHGIFRHIAGAAAPVTVAELTAAFELNHNAIRQHLATFVHAGLVTEELAPPAGPGRRKLRYRIAPTAAAWGGDNPYEQLSVLLLDVLRSNRSARDVGVDAGRRLASGRRTGSANPTATLVDLVARQGFEPRLTQHGDHTEVILEHCPFAAAAAADPATICELHRGLAEGMVDALDGDLTVTDLVARNPKRAGCRLQLTSQGADDV